MPANTYEYEPIFDDRPGYLHVLVRAETMTADMALDYLERVAEKARELGARRILLERDVPVMLNAVDMFTFDFRLLFR